MKRRDFMRCVGIGGASLGLGVNTSRAAALFDASPSQSTLPLAPIRYETATLNAHGRLISRRRHHARLYRQDLGRGESVDMILIPDHELARTTRDSIRTCGSPVGSQRSVKVNSFLMAKTPITQAQWEAAAYLPKVRRDLKPRPSYVRGETHPVECVSWTDAQEFCARLSRHSGLWFRLPREDEWEGACRAETTTPFHFGATITSDYANYSGSFLYASEESGIYRGSTTPVELFLPNAYGLHDMHGNVWEWCADHWHDHYNSAPGDRTPRSDAANENTMLRVLRGGAWADSPEKLRSASRSGYPADSLNRCIGLRVALDISNTDSEKLCHSI